MGKLLITLLVVVGLLGLVACGGGGGEQPAAQTSKLLGTGESGYIDAGGVMILCRDIATYERLVQLINAKDVQGVEQLADSATAFVVDDGTKVLVIEPGIMRMEVRVKEGLHEGESGYCAPEFVKR